ncbi:ferredoxin domain-containing protein [Chloroflexota bacterium]
MARISSAEAELDAIRDVARMMAAAARTAPKTRGVDTVKTMVVDGDDLETIATAMEDATPGRPDTIQASMRRDANNVRQSACVVLMGVTGAPKKPEIPLDCGACGFETCDGLANARNRRRGEDDFSGPVCAFASIDLGLALGSAVKLAADHGIDNRIMYTMGVGASKLGWLEADIVLGIPLSASGKSIYFDRG